MFGNMKKVFLGVALVGEIMVGNCLGSEEITTLSSNHSSSIVNSKEEVVIPLQKNYIKDQLKLPDNISKSLAPLINEINQSVISSEVDEIESLAELISSELFNSSEKTYFAEVASFTMTQHILECEGKRALLWYHVAKKLGRNINDEIAGQIASLLRYKNY